MLVSTIKARELKDEAFGQDTVNRPASVLITVTHRLSAEQYLGGVNAEGGQVGFGWNIDEDKLTFIAVDERFLTTAEALAWAVLRGHAEAAGPLADKVLEEWNGAMKTAEPAG